MTPYRKVMLADFCRYFAFSTIVIGAVLGLAGAAEAIDGRAHVVALAAGLVQRVFPMSLLIAALFTVGIRSRYLEIMAFHSAGLSLAQVTWPLLLPAAVSFLLSYSLLQWCALEGGGVRFQSALAQASLSPVAVLVGIVAAAGARRPRVSSRFLAALGILFVYYLLDATAQTLGRFGGLPQGLVVWMPVTVTGLPALVLWLREGWR